MSPLPHDPRSRPARGTGQILVTGATGLLGRSICWELGRRRVHHRALVRPSADRDALHGAGEFTWMIEGDLLRPGSLGAAVDGITGVLHLAGLVRSGDAAACEALHVDGTRALLEAATADRSGPVRVVALSSDTVLRSHLGAYGSSKAAMERLVLDAPGIEAVILRPPMMLGPGSPHLRALEKAARMPVVPVPDGVARRAPVHVDDVRDAALAALALPAEAFSGGPLVLDLPGAEELPFGEVVQALARARGWRVPKVMEVPRPLSSGALRMLDRLGAKERAARIERTVDGMRESVRGDGAAAATLLGWSPRSLAEVFAGT